VANSILVGGPEDGTEIDVAWPPSPILSRRVGDEIIHYHLEDQSKLPMRWKAQTKRDRVVDPKAEGQPEAEQNAATQKDAKRAQGGRGA